MLLRIYLKTTKAICMGKINKMIFIDASFYLSLLNPNDSNHQKAIELSEQHKKGDYATSQSVLGEVLTVGSQRFDKSLTVEFVEEIFKSHTKIVLEKRELVKDAFNFFKSVKSKNVSWVDSYSFVIMKRLGIKKLLTFDKHLKQLARS